MPIADKVAREMGIPVVYYLNTEKNDFSSQMRDFKVEGVPSFIYVEDGKLEATYNDEEYIHPKYYEENSDLTYEDFYRDTLTNFFKDNYED